MRFAARCLLRYLMGQAEKAFPESLADLWRGVLPQRHSTPPDTILMAADLSRAVGAMSALAMEPASMSASFVSLLGTDRTEFGRGQALDGSLHNFTLAFPQAPEASAGWRWECQQYTPCLCRVGLASRKEHAHCLPT